jgi:NAD(P)-dependent dehydrogenase (short-subunit alcohol dehydrogenase family)
MQLKFQTALSAGSSRGLGRQTAVQLATEDVVQTMTVDI